MLASNLEKLGLDEKEAKIYLAALELEQATIQQISRKSGVKRTTAYDIIESLKKRGLMSTSAKESRTMYSAEDPRKIDQNLDEKKELFKKMLPELLSISNVLEKKPGIRYFEGIEGIKTIYKDTLAFPDQEMCSWWASDYTIIDPKWFYDYYMPARLAKKIWVRTIAPENELMKKIQGEDQSALRQVRLISPEEAPFEVEVALYGKSKIAMMSFEEQFGLIIESRKIYNTLKSIFEIQWKALPKNTSPTKNII